MREEEKKPAGFLALSLSDFHIFERYNYQFCQIQRTNENMQSQKAVLKLDLNDGTEKKKKATEIASGFAGAESIAVDMKDKKLTVVGTTDPVELVEKLGKPFPTEIVSVGPAKEAQKKDDNKSNENEQSEDPEPDPPKVYPFPFGHRRPLPPPAYYFPDSPPLYNYGRYPQRRSIFAEEDPNACVIC